jgi:ribonuclease BN (tRNA processing enzyme)
MAELIILGSGTGVPSLKRGSPGLVVVTEGSRILIDSGPGTLRRLLEVGLTYHDMDLLLYTHIHPDHVSDLVPFLFASKYSDLPRKRDLLCVGGPGFRRYFNKIRKVYGSWIDSEFYQFTLKEISRRRLIFQDLQISAKSMAHLPESVGYRIEFKDGESLAISGDTDYCRNLVELASEVNLLVLECSFPTIKRWKDTSPVLGRENRIGIPMLKASAHSFLSCMRPNGYPQRSEGGLFGRDHPGEDL